MSPKNYSKNYFVMTFSKYVNYTDFLSKLFIFSSYFLFSSTKFVFACNLRICFICFVSVLSFLPKIIVREVYTLLDESFLLFFPILILYKYVDDVTFCGVSSYNFCFKSWILDGIAVHAFRIFIFALMFEFSNFDWPLNSRIYFFI